MQNVEKSYKTASVDKTHQYHLKLYNDGVNLKNFLKEECGPSSPQRSDEWEKSTATDILSSCGELHHQVLVNVHKSGTDKNAEANDMIPKTCMSPGNNSYNEQCRVCQQSSEEPILNLGCNCRGELAYAHRTCIDIWFRTRGTNRCEICQQISANVPAPESQPNVNYWIWRIDPTLGISNVDQGERERSYLSPLWIACTILIGGLLLDVLISISLGISQLPVNIIIGVLIVLGLGTALRLGLDCCYDWNARRSIQQGDTNLNTSHYPAV